MSKGRKQLPEGLKQLRGTDRKDRALPATIDSAVLPIATVQEIKTPGYLSKDAKKIFRHYAIYLVNNRIIRPGDLHLLAAYASSAAQFVECENEIHTPDFKKFYEAYSTTGLARFIPNPYLKLRRDSLEEMLKIGAQFGLSPVSYAALQRIILPAKDKDKYDEFAEFD